MYFEYKIGNRYFQGSLEEVRKLVMIHVNTADMEYTPSGFFSLCGETLYFDSNKTIGEIRQDLRRRVIGRFDIWFNNQDIVFDDIHFKNKQDLEKYLSDQSLRHEYNNVFSLRGIKGTFEMERNVDRIKQILIRRVLKRYED
ncbi:MAG: hypothetical protein ACFFG0_08310 [Candidatus Thorarchaeota archaeon]